MGRAEVVPGPTGSWENSGSCSWFLREWEGAPKEGSVSFSKDRQSEQEEKAPDCGTGKDEAK